ncbi:hypothetical protein [Ensifer aridi]|uniref:hypothetical protein n=1 Tax=Ensifer aridi TaxID=1708715 RepID=UPI000A119141|nr:hypothetical protein [Ensifer aridi]
MYRRLATLISVIGLSACAGPATRMDSSLVQVPAIIGALKCAFATALLKEKEKGQIRRLENTIASGTLTLNVVHKVSRDFSVQAEAAAGGPFVFSYAGGTGSFLPRFSHSNVATNTIKTEIDFRYYMWAKDADVCSNASVQANAKYGFSEWLAAVISGLDANSYEYPLGQADALKYEAEFGVVAKDNAGLDFDIVFLSGSAGTENERSDVQKIKFTIAAESKDNPPPDIWSQNNGQGGRNR